MLRPLGWSFLLPPFPLQPPAPTYPTTTGECQGGGGLGGGNCSTTAKLVKTSHQYPLHKHKYFHVNTVRILLIENSSASLKYQILTRNWQPTLRNTSIIKFASHPSSIMEIKVACAGFPAGLKIRWSPSQSQVPWNIINLGLFFLKKKILFLSTSFMWFDQERAGVKGGAGKSGCLRHR